MMSENSTLYSIGHGHKTMEEFIAELRHFSIEYIIDVRTSPYSKWAPHFNKDIIENWLAEAEVKYIYMGDSIGGKPQNDLCYDEEGYFDYQRMAENPKFKEGLYRLVTAHIKQLSVAILCAETDPSLCHRSKLIGRELYFTYHINMHHITGVGKFVTQTSIMMELTKGDWSPEGNLFGSCEPPHFKSRKAYKYVNSDYENSYD
jgi:uncharacterized protein (DUF488 family)